MKPEKKRAKGGERGRKEELSSWPINLKITYNSLLMRAKCGNVERRGRGGREEGREGQVLPAHAIFHQNTSL